MPSKQDRSTHDNPGPLHELLNATHRLVPDELPALVDSQGSHLGGDAAVVYLSDLDERRLVALPDREARRREPLSIDQTVAGRSFRELDLLRSGRDDGGTIFWVPILDGTE